MENRMWELLMGAMNGESMTAVLEAQQKRDVENIVETQLLPIKHGDGKEKEQNEYRNWLQVSGITVVEQYDNLMMRVLLPEGWTFKRDAGGYWTYVLDEKGRKRASFFYKSAFWDRESFFCFDRRFSVYGTVADYNRKEFEQKPKYIQDGFEESWMDIEKAEKIDGISKRERNIISITREYDGSTVCEYEDGTFQTLVKKPKYVPNPDYVPMTGYEEYSQPFHYEVRDCDKTVIFSSDIVKTDFEWTQETHDAFWRNREAKEKQAREQCLTWINTHYPNWEDVLAYWNE